MDHDFYGLLRFETFELDVRSRELYHCGHRVPIQLQPFKLLTYLVLHSGEAIARETLRRQLWSDRTFVDFEAGLNFCIRQIRKALGEDARRPRLLETLNRRGYRFIPTVERVQRKAALPRSAERRITVTLSSQGGMPGSTLNDDETIERLVDEITRLLVKSYSAGDKPPLVSRTFRRGTSEVHPTYREVSITGASRAVLRLE